VVAKRVLRLQGLTGELSHKDTGAFELKVTVRQNGLLVDRDVLLLLPGASTTASCSPLLPTPGEPTEQVARGGAAVQDAGVASTSCEHLSTSPLRSVALRSGGRRPTQPSRSGVEIAGWTALFAPGRRSRERAVRRPT